MYSRIPLKVIPLLCRKKYRSLNLCLEEECHLIRLLNNWDLRRLRLSTLSRDINKQDLFQWENSKRPGKMRKKKLRSKAMKLHKFVKIWSRNKWKLNTLRLNTWTTLNLLFNTLSNPGFIFQCSFTVLCDILYLIIQISLLWPW